MTEKLDLDAIEDRADDARAFQSTADGIRYVGASAADVPLLVAEVRKLRANVSSGRMTCDISAALRRLADGRPEIASLLAESADQLDELITLLAKAETARDRYKKLFDEKVEDRRRLVGLMRADGNELRQLREQRDKVLALCELAEILCPHLELDRDKDGECRCDPVSPRAIRHIYGAALPAQGQTEQETRS